MDSEGDSLTKLSALQALGSYEPRDWGSRCDACPFGQERKFVPAAPPSSGKVKLVVVGEGPGRMEVIRGEPFVGSSGQLLNDVFRKAEMPFWRRETWITNASLCSSPGATDQEKDEAAACCAPRLMKELESLPKEAPIIALGKPAARSLLGVNGIMKVRGFVWRVRELSDATLRGARRAAEKVKLDGLKRWEREEAKREKALLELKAELLEGRAKLAGRVVLPSIHPAFVLRTETWRPVLEIDIDRAARWLRGEVKLLDQEVKYRVLKTRAEVEKFLPRLGREISHDIETDSKDPLEAVIRCVGVSDGKNTFVIYPWRKSYAPLLTRCFKKRVVIGHNSYAYDNIALKREGVEYGEVEDTLVAHHSFASHFPQGLAFVASCFCDASPWKITFKQGAEGAEKGIPPSKLPPEDLVRYNAADVVLTLRAWKEMQADLADEMKVYLHDKALAEMCQGMQIAGIQVDLEKREWLIGALKRRSGRLLRKMRSLVGKKSFNPYAAADLRYALFEKFKAPVLTLTGKTQVPSTSADVLQSLAQSRTRYGKLSRLVLKYRGARGTLKRNILGVFVGRDGRVHATWKSFGTPTGRLSCKMQQLPRIANKKKPALEDRIRELYVCREGYIIVYFDIKQAEMKFAAFLAEDENFIKVAMSKDVHAANAKLIWPEAAERIEEGKADDLRSIAKSAGFAVNYGSSESTLFQYFQKQNLKVPVTLRAVRQLLSVLHREFKTHFRHVDRNIKEVERLGYMRTPLLGRIRWFGWHPKPAEIMNTPVQAGVADHINERMLEMAKKMPKDCTLIFQGHDSAGYECKLGKAQESMKELIIQTMARPVRLGNGREFVLAIDMKEGFRLSEV